MDFIWIDELRLPVFIGVYAREKLRAQTLEISLQIGTNSQNAGKSDVLADTIDYQKVVEKIESTTRTQHFELLEKLAEHIATILLQEFGALSVRVSIAKLGALKNVRRVGITIERVKSA